MKFYLSSYKLGNETDKLKELIPLNNKTAYISNALDFSNDLERRVQSEKGDIEQLENIGLNVENIDLREYFGKPEELKNKLKEFGVVMIRGGNCFVLMQALKKSGFDKILKDMNINQEDKLYIGYSAGICILGPTLKGIHLMDKPEEKPYGVYEVNYDALGILPEAIVPHYQSDHKESDDATKAVEYLKKNAIPFKTLSDGEVIIIE